MSAIAGIHNFNQKPIPPEWYTGMKYRLDVYPTDDVQVWKKQSLVLSCHTRWLMPECIGARLAYYDEKMKLAITADVILDNREELFDLLQIAYMYRRDMTDNEIILHAYRKWGEACPRYLVGDFSFVIWDESQQLLFGARDFAGNRPLYFYYDTNCFVFCTLIQPILSVPYIKQELNEYWLADFLAVPNMTDSPDPYATVYKKIQQLPPSYSFVLHNGKLLFSHYDAIGQIQDLRLKSDVEYEEVFREVFHTAVSARLRTHHKVGSFLSGGLDSGSVVAFAASELRKQQKSLYTFSSVPIKDYENWTMPHFIADETPYIKEIVDFVGNAESNYMDFQKSSPFSEIDDWLNIMEMPYKFFENSFWVRGIYEQACQKGIGVLLNGARGNFTISWGPALDYYTLLAKQFKFSKFWRETNLYSSNMGVNSSKVREIAIKRAFPRINRNARGTEGYEYPSLVNTELAARTDVYGRMRKFGVDLENKTRPSIQEIRNMHFKQTNIWNVTGTSAAKLSLRYGLQAHDPTNDLRVVRLCLSVPIDQFVQNGMGRALIRRVTKDMLPDKVRLNQNFRGMQGADIIFRMLPTWRTFLDELNELKRDKDMSQYLNMNTITNALAEIGSEPKPEYVLNPYFRILMRSLIVYRFMKNSFERR